MLARRVADEIVMFRELELKLAPPLPFVLAEEIDSGSQPMGRSGPLALLRESDPPMEFTKAGEQAEDVFTNKLDMPDQAGDDTHDPALPQAVESLA